MALLCFALSIVIVLPTIGTAIVLSPKVDSKKERKDYCFRILEQERATTIERSIKIKAKN